MHDHETLPDRMASRLTEDGLAIYLFHGVIKHQIHPVRNYTGKHIQVDLFNRCLTRLAESGYPLSMEQVLAHQENGEALPPRAFAITFDDGFENNLSIAGPVLADLQIPAMIYVTSGFIEENGMSWIDRIEYAVEEAPNQVLKFSWASEPFHITDAQSRITLLSAIRNYVKTNSNCDADAFADELCTRLGKPGSLTSNDPLDRKLTWKQVRQANESDFFSVGGHSHTHAILSFLSAEQLAFELDTSLSLMWDKAAIDSTHYSYPEGLAHCYSAQVIDALKQRGVRCCPTAIDGVNTSMTDPFHLLRIMVA